MFWPEFKFPPINLLNCPRKMIFKVYGEKYVECKNCKGFEPIYKQHPEYAGMCNKGKFPVYGMYFIGDRPIQCNEFEDKG